MGSRGALIGRPSARSSKSALTHGNDLLPGPCEELAPSAEKLPSPVVTRCSNQPLRRPARASFRITTGLCREVALSLRATAPDFGPRGSLSLNVVRIRSSNASLPSRLPRSAAASCFSQTTTIALEGQAFTVSGTVAVQYGAGGNSAQTLCQRRGQCTNEFFSTDPAYGIVRQVVSGRRRHRRAHDGRDRRPIGLLRRFEDGPVRRLRQLDVKTLSGGGQCTNEFFGRDRRSASSVARIAWSTRGRADGHCLVDHADDSPAAADRDTADRDTDGAYLRRRLRRHGEPACSRSPASTT